MAMRVWWIPQIPMKAFRVPVCSVRQARFLLNTLAAYDLFQLENGIKPDFANTGGLEVLEDGEWIEYDDGDGNDVWHEPPDTEEP